MADKAETVMTERSAKKNSVRFTAKEDDAPLHDVYVPKVTLAQLDRLESGSIKVTIEAA